MQVMVNKEDLEAANEAVKELKKEIDGYVECVHSYMRLNCILQEKWEQSQVEISQLRARLSEFEVQP